MAEKADTLLKLPASKSRLDKAGSTLSQPLDELTEEYLDLEQIFDEYRELHLEPLTKLTANLQNFLGGAVDDYYIAQRLKRRPQILRKLRRLSTRLTQLQDIGGLRIIVEDNERVDALSKLIDQNLAESEFNLVREADYRPEGRDDSGYRALHKIVRNGPISLEIQLRTRAQHYWAESIERTSVFYGRRLKEGEGSEIILRYFKVLSECFSSIERGWHFSQEALQNLDDLRRESEELVRRDGHPSLIDGVVNQDVVKTLVEAERSNPSRLNNWILVFDWKTANFLTWEIVSRDPREAMDAYSRYEKQFPETESYEVVLIGSSDVETVQKTHSHYFGLSGHGAIFEELGQSITKISDDFELNKGSKTILSRLSKKKIWGEAKGMQRQTLKNHFCKDVHNFEECLDFLVKAGYVLEKGGAGITLNQSLATEIEKLI